MLAFAAFYVLTQTYFWLVSIWLILFAALAFYSLIRTIESHKRELANFLLGISQNDYSNSYRPELKSSEDQDLHLAYTTITDTMRHLRQESESNYHFLQTVVEHSSIAMIGYQESDLKVTLMNEAAKTLFNKPFMKNLSGLKPVSKILFEEIINLSSGGKKLVKLKESRGLINLSVSAKEMKLDSGFFKLVTFQNINAELDEKELESWQKLIRVLTHEIKNSAIPISTLTEVVNQLITDETGELRDLSTLDEEDLEDLKIGINTVEKRSKGLVKFVNAYGELAKVPEPTLKEVDVEELMTDVLSLLSNDLKRNDILLIKSFEEGTILMDRELIEQVLINLIKNAKEALTHIESASITLTFKNQNGQKTIAVGDNGSGIEPSVLDNIFVPFFTTKKDGSGIGLSLSRQIMRAHKGNITVHSKEGIGTTFELVF